MSIAQPQIVSPKSQEGFTFVQISDPQLGFREEQGFAEGEELLRSTVATINSIHPAFVVVTGDMVNSLTDTAQLKAYLQLIDLIDKSIPVFHLPGNHDMGASNKEHREAYLKHYGYDRFAFKYGNCALIGINSCPIRDNDNDLEQEQYQWLCNTLEQYADTSLKLLFLHCPIVVHKIDEKEGYSNFSFPMRNRYIELLKSYGVSAVFAGHLHNTAHCVVDGVEMITCGPSGKPLGSGVSGINVVKVSNDTFTFNYLTD
ncbi:MAG: metallophosphoesterase [Tidjanibacter sp.]|nr:metallophosphoesterase [Tidjanibacter sp.]